MSAARASPTPSPVKMTDEKKVNADALPSVDDERPKFLKDPFGWYAQLSYRRPRTMFATAWGFIFLLCAIGAPFFKQSDSGDYDWLLGRDSAIVQRSYSLKQVQERASQFTELAERTVPQTEQLFHLMYEARGSDNLLKPAMLKEMLEIEKVLFTDKRYAAYCVAEVADVNTCSADGYKSPLTMFYTISITRDGNNQTVYSADPIAIPGGGGANYVDTEAGIKARMALVLASASGPKAKLWFDAGFNEDGVSTDARYMQAFYFLGMPLDGYSNPADRNEEQRVPGNAMLLDASDALKLRFGMKETWSKSSFQTEATVATADGEMKVYWWSLPGQENEWQTLSSKDLNFTVLSFLGVMVYVAYHTGSIIISAASMLMTVTSIFVAFFWFRVVFQVSFFQFINFLIIYDAGFDPSTAAAQAHLMQSYESLKTAACGAKACSGGKLADPLVTIRNIVAETDATGAVIGGFYKYLNDLGGAYASSHPVNAPVTSDTFNVQMCKYAKLDATKVRYAGHVGYYVKDCDASPVPSARFILIEATSSIRMPQAPVDFTEAQDDWEVFGNSLDVGAPAELTGAEATSTNIFWLWSVTSISLMDNVYLGLAVCFPMVFFVLSVSTGNVILAFYSTVTIAGIVTTVIGIGAGGIMGWDLGTTEAIAAVIVIGFSVDYCVHLANAYIENDAVDRVSRTRIALTTMGISVTAGAITTIIAGAFLAFCILTFFVKFAFLICWTIFSSYIWAVIFFGALCMTAGPSGKFGDISWLLAKMFPWCH